MPKSLLDPDDRWFGDFQLIEVPFLHQTTFLNYEISNLQIRIDKHGRKQKEYKVYNNMNVQHNYVYEDLNPVEL